MLTAFSESDLQALVSAAYNACVNIAVVFQTSAYLSRAKKAVSDIESYNKYWIGENESATILKSYASWKSPGMIAAIERTLKITPPAWVFPYYWFHTALFASYGAKFKKLYEVCTTLRSAYPYMEQFSAWENYIALYKQFQDNNPAEPEKSGLDKSLKEAWDKISPILKWGAIGIAAIMALSGLTKEKK
jgi:hypothetical protein